MELLECLYTKQKPRVQSEKEALYCFADIYILLYLLRDALCETFVAEVPSTTDLLEGELNIKDDSNGSESIFVEEVKLEEDPPRSDCKFASRSSFFKAR